MRFFAASVLLALTANACGAKPAGEPSNPAGDPNDPDPVLSPAAWSALQALSPETLPSSPPDISNAFSDDARAAAFGQQLFFDPSFSGPLLDTDNDGGESSLGKPGETGRVACSGCHLPESGFSDTRSFQLQISLGAGWGRRRAPSLLDVGQAQVIMWDGRHDALYNQPFGPLESVVEMNSSRLFMAEQIFSKYRTTYEAIFAPKFGPMPPLDDANRFPALSATLTGCQPSNPSDPAPACDGAFHGMPHDGAEFDGMTADDQTAVTQIVVNAGKAIAAYERLLTCGTTPFDAWMHGGAAVSRAAQRGAALFVGSAGCASCHSGAFLSDQKFHNVGLQPVTVQQAFIDANDQGATVGVASAIADPLNTRGAFSDGDDGRLPETTTSTMLGAFRTPTLRCVSSRPSFMHTGQLRTLANVVTFFDVGGSSSGYLGTSEIQALNLSPLAESDLVAFLESLAGPGAEPRLLMAP